jgi:hypothetical protein
MQIAGNNCRICGGNIILSRDGKFCAHCQTAVHLRCEPRSECGVCGQTYQDYEAPKADPLREAVLPRALRPARSGGPVFAITAAVLFALLTMMLWYIFAHGH